MSLELQFNNAEATLIQDGNLDVHNNKIMNTRYIRGEVTSHRTFLSNFRFMGAPHFWHNSSGEPVNKEGEIYNRIAIDTSGNSSVAIGKVALNIKQLFGGGSKESSHELLYKLGKNCDWYKRFFALNAYFDKRLFDPLWVRNWGDGKSFYIEDGNSRALCYALRLFCGEAKFTPVKLIWCKSWRHALSWADTCEDPAYYAPINLHGITWV